jgi:glycosyltransferase involved in cell wall biosynthesis
VSTTLGAEGFEVMADRELLLADDVAAFAKAIEELLANRDRTLALGMAGRAFAVEHYDWRRIVPQLEAVYRTLTV